MTPDASSSSNAPNFDTMYPPSGAIIYLKLREEGSSVVTRDYDTY